MGVIELDRGPQRGKVLRKARKFNTCGGKVERSGSVWVGREGSETEREGVSFSP